MINRQKWLFNRFDPKFISWCTLIAFKKFRELIQDREMKYNGPYMLAPQSNTKQNFKPNVRHKYKSKYLKNTNNIDILL